MAQRLPYWFFYQYKAIAGQVRYNKPLPAACRLQPFGYLNKNQQNSGVSYRQQLRHRPAQRSRQAVNLLCCRACGNSFQPSASNLHHGAVAAQHTPCGGRADIGCINACYFCRIADGARIGGIELAVEVVRPYCPL